MSAFATQLASIIEHQFAGNQARFSEVAHVYGSTVSRLVREEVVPSAETIEAFAKSLPRESAAALCGAFLRDLIPHELRSDVAVWLSHEMVGSKPKSPLALELLDPESRESITLLATLALENHEARHALNCTANFLRGEQLSSKPTEDPVSIRADKLVRHRIRRQKPAAE